jgi:hypothetical protein
VAVKFTVVLLAVVRLPEGVPLITPVVELSDKPAGRGEALKLVGVLLPVIV